jgi:hypothetical protein
VQAYRLCKGTELTAAAEKIDRAEMERWNPSWGWMRGAKMVPLGAFYSDGAASQGDGGGELAVAGGAPLIQRLLEEEATRWPFDEGK